MALVLAVILFRTTGEPLLPPIFRQWDALLPFTVYFGQRRPLIEGLFLTLVTSHFYSLCSSAPIGIFVSHHLLIFVLAKSLSFVMYASRWPSILLVLLALSLVSRVGFGFVASAFGHSLSHWSTFGTTLAGVILTSFVGLIEFLSMSLTDRMTLKTAAINIELADEI